MAGVLVPDSGSIDLRSVAERTEGFDGADINELCKAIKMNAIRRNVQSRTAEIQDDDVEKALKTAHLSVDCRTLIRYEEYTRNLKG